MNRPYTPNGCNTDCHNARLPCSYCQIRSSKDSIAAYRCRLAEVEQAEQLYGCPQSVEKSERQYDDGRKAESRRQSDKGVLTSGKSPDI
ncbi:unnamed protein product [Lasius platythorax]|uniref:Uncharacterized protein n=1 Tax=Lasius platythorax TaxID=488582 RepID=A0AAV2N5D4_9HYME